MTAKSGRVDQHSEAQVPVLHFEDCPLTVRLWLKLWFGCCDRVLYSRVNNDFTNEKLNQTYA